MTRTTLELASPLQTSSRRQSLSDVVSLRLIDIITIHLQSHDLGQRHNLVDSRLHRYCLKPLEVTFDNAFRPNLLPSRREGSLGDLFPPIFDYLGVDKDMEVMFPKLSENKTGPFMASRWLIGCFNDISEHKFAKICDHKQC
ncbi:hypothetical protein AVEN_48738-1 [Araneus ventricosus]|uniref:Uncharacterized protein n=1 Tax=Araneus ventricosus TaxID=182803 RepID=A0A4Y2V6E8_ARAVE|nr:hypothetical protein AVEN_5189-1 [Araneus ventricosus]GBO20148.1 hypothetical protein AVEN_48738-1 [Araneus ventricosus]